MFSPENVTARALEPSHPKWWLRALDAGDGTLALLLLAPAALSLAVIIVYPVCRLIYTSFFSLSLTSGLPAEFIGFGNYQAMLSDPVFWQTTGNTVLITIITVPGALVLGLALALLANLPFRVQWPSSFAADAVGDAAVVCRSDLRVVFPVGIWRRQ